MGSDRGDIETVRASFRHRFEPEKANGFNLNCQLKIPARGITTIFGASGSGKTSFLRCIAGLLEAEQGELNVCGEVWQDKSNSLPTHQRPIGYVFQEPRLFPHLTARGNLYFASRRAEGGHDEDLFQQVVALMEIEHFLERQPEQLSGGEKQRVAIARALLIKPRLMLMDEPLSALDMQRKREIFPFLEKLRERAGLPILYVTHSVDEVARLANYIVVMEQGRVVRQGKFSEVFASADFSKQLAEDTGVVLEATVVQRESSWHLIRAEIPGGEFWIPDTGYAEGSKLRLRILASDVSLARVAHTDSSILNLLKVEVEELIEEQDPAMQLLRLRLGGSTLLARLTRLSVNRLQIVKGDQLWAQIKSVAVVS